MLREVPKEQEQQTKYSLTDCDFERKPPPPTLNWFCLSQRRKLHVGGTNDQLRTGQAKKLSGHVI